MLTQDRPKSHGMTTVFKEHQLKSPLSDTDSGPLRYVCIDAVGSSGILKAKQKLCITCNFDKQDVVDFMKLLAERLT
jgi:hypothetical protein